MTFKEGAIVRVIRLDPHDLIRGVRINELLKVKMMSPVFYDVVRLVRNNDYLDYISLESDKVIEIAVSKLEKLIYNID